MSWLTLRALRLAVLVGAVILAVPGAALAKTEIYWWHALQATLGERVNEMASKFKRVAERLRGEGDLQRLVSGDAERRHRRLSGQAGAAHRAGLRGRNADHAVLGRGVSGLPADEGQQHG